MKNIFNIPALRKTIKSLTSHFSHLSSLFSHLFKPKPVSTPLSLRAISTLTLALTLTLTSCQKDNDPKKVTYFVKGFGDPYKIVYTYGDGSKTKTEKVDPKGISDVWSFSFSDMPGEITYFYIESKEDISNSMSFNASILIDGKTFQKAQNYDREIVSGTDTVKVIKRSGTIPF
jgi:hypothetical protein